MVYIRPIVRYTQKPALFQLRALPVSATLKVCESEAVQAWVQGRAVLVWCVVYKQSAAFVCYHIKVGQRTWICDCLLDADKLTVRERSVQTQLEELANGDSGRIRVAADV